ncbi:MAG: EF-P lysine aminoacylase EpmA [Gammaproteobacteria bacterium]
MKPETDWRPTAPHENLQARARILAEIRSFFAARGVLEVETPLLSAGAATAPHLQSLTTHYSGPFAPHGRDLFLQTSPEFAMKRLLAAGSGPIYQICKAFRNGEAGRLHNPEFTLLEWYRPGFDQYALMDEVELLVSGLLADVLTDKSTERISYRDAFLRYVKVDIDRASIAELRACADAQGIVTSGLDDNDRDTWLELLLSHSVEPRLGHGRLCFLYDYPASQAALARIKHNPPEPDVAERFELYINGIELASGYHELSDSAEQHQRFEQDRARRRALQATDTPLDKHLLAALGHGLPDCAGVAVGLDRLIMLAAGAIELREVLAFPIDRA